MSRLFSLLSIGSLLARSAAYFAAEGPTGGSPAGNSPSPPDDVVGIEVTDLGRVLFPDPAGNGPGNTLRLKLVEFAAGAVPPADGHAHDGAFVLSVQEGAVCYRNLVSVGQGATVTARVSGTAPAPAGCAVNRTDCDGPNGCTLQPGDIVYLPEGSSINQSDTVVHWYGNVDQARAVVYLAEYQLGQDAAPCGGTCH